MFAASLSSPPQEAAALAAATAAAAAADFGRGVPRTPGRRRSSMGVIGGAASGRRDSFAPPAIRSACRTSVIALSYICYTRVVYIQKKARKKKIALAWKLS